MKMAKTAGDSLGWFVLLSVGVGSLIQAASCSPNTTHETTSLTTDQVAIVEAILASFWPDLLAPTLAQAVDDVDELTRSTQAWLTELEAGEDGVTARADVQTAWINAMTSWQAMEVLQVGPAASSLYADGGMDIRDNLYSWPSTNPCRVDQETVEGNWDEDDFFTVNLVNVMGFDAMEVLLFSSDEENRCSTPIDINADGTWDALGDDGVRLNRAAYSLSLSEQMAVELSSIQTAWSPKEENFHAILNTAGNDVYANKTAALNALYDALFYLETSVNDRKLGWSLGYNDCGQDDCSDYLESPFAGNSTVWVAQNLTTFRALFMGVDGAGFYDLLTTFDEVALADELVTALDTADSAASLLSDALPTTQSENAEDGDALYDAVKRVTDLLKGDIATVLTLQIPSEAAGDVD
jgi:predicted lipoprotein